MKKFFNVIKELIHGGNHNKPVPEKFDITIPVQVIKKIEAEHKIEPGRRIHSFYFMEFELSLDLEITGTYRLVVYEGREKRYSFSISCSQGDYEKLVLGLEGVVNFLTGERKIKNLPKNELLKGHYFGL